MPVSHLTLLGEHPNSNGRVWKIFADNQTVDVTPAVTSTHTNYDFTVSATKLKLKLIRNSIDVTGMVQPVYVGEPISLLCELNPPVHPISNFNWTVPGLTISNYVADASTGKVHHAYSTTNSTVTFHWVDGHELATIVVSAQINGFTLFGVTYFKVQRPNATLIAELLNVVAVDNRVDW